MSVERWLEQFTGALAVLTIATIAIPVLVRSVPWWIVAVPTGCGLLFGAIYLLRKGPH